MKFLSIVLLLCFLGAVFAAPQLLYTRKFVPKGWSKTHVAAGHESVSFTLALKQRNLDILDKWFNEVSDPRHANYQEFMEIDQILDIVAPKDNDVAKVMHWLHSHGVDKKHITSFGDAIDVKTTADVASRLFHTQFYHYKHSETNATLVRQFGDYSIAADIKPLVDMVAGISSFPIPRLGRKKKLSNAPNDGPANDVAVIPQTLQALYSIPASAFSGVPDGKTSQGVIEFQGQNYAPSDLAAFGQQSNINIQAVAQTVGPNDPTNPQGEAQLDIQLIAGVNTVATNWFWLEQGNGWLYQFVTHFFSTPTVPQVNSISYGWWEGDQCSLDSDECSQLGVDSYGYVNRINVEFQKIALRGISLLVSSGDSGANGRTDDGCTIPRLRPSFPASSPYVTAVGANQISNPVFNLQNPPPICASSGMQCPSGGTEVAVSYAIAAFASGGGFSDAAPTPSWQQSAVQGYFNSGVQLPPAGYYNATGRGYPDVSAIGHNTMTVQNGVVTAEGGTSASAPIFAAVVSLLNQAQIAKTGKPLGFLNPFLYQMQATAPGTFQDVTSGDNICTENGCSSSCQGYYAYKGWDPVTGLGSPNAQAMLNYIKGMKYPAKQAKLAAQQAHATSSQKRRLANIHKRR